MTVYICVAFLMCTAVFSFQGKGLHPEQLGWPSPVGSCRGLEIATAAAAAKSRQSCPTLCDSIDGSPPGFPVPGILQATTLEWVAISFSDVSKWKVKEVAHRVRPSVTPWTAAYPGSSVHGIFQARVLEWNNNLVVFKCYRFHEIRKCLFSSLFRSYK